MGIIHTAKKDVPGLLYKKYSETNRNFDPKEVSLTVMFFVICSNKKIGKVNRPLISSMLDKKFLAIVNSEFFRGIMDKFLD